MGQSLTKEENQSKQRSRGESRIQSDPTFDSHFTLISPVSDLSDPSKFFERRDKRINRVSKAPARLERNDSKVVIRNAPPLPVTQQKKRKKRGKKDKGQSESKPRKTKTSLTGCVIVSTEHAQKMRDVTGGAQKEFEEGYNGTPFVTGHMRFNGNGNNENKNGNNTNYSLPENERSIYSANHIYSQNTVRHQQDLSEIKVLGTKMLQETVTPLAHLESTFEKALAIHHESDYFNRLVGPVEPSPAVLKTEQQIFQSMFPQSKKKFLSDSPLPSASLFSETSMDIRNRSERESGREDNMNGEEKITIFDDGDEESATYCSKGENTKEICEKTNEFSAGNESEEATTDKKVKDKALGASRFGISHAEDERRNSTGAHSNEIRHKISIAKLTCETRHKDYREIGFSKSEGELPEPACNYLLELDSPSNWSVNSLTSSGGGKPLDNQALSNAAFLFSPSYAGGDEKLLKRQQKFRDPVFSISTFASRARLCDVSSRSKPTVRIPINNSGERIMDRKRLDFFGASTIKKSNKHVRFSNSDESFQLTQAHILNKLDSTGTDEIDECKEVVEATNVGSLENGNEVHSHTGSNEGKRSIITQDKGKQRWTYREEDGKMFATPNLGKKSAGDVIQPASSISRRFTAAKAKFSVATSIAKRFNTVGNRIAEKSNQKTSLSNTRHINTELEQSKETQEKKTFSSKTSVTETSLESRYEDGTNISEPCFKRVYTPAIETKMSDLTDPTYTQKKWNAEESSLATTSTISRTSYLSGERSNSSTITSLNNTVSPESKSIQEEGSNHLSPQQASIQWSYREQDGKITATPNLGKKNTKKGIIPAASPALRFNAAKHRFSATNKSNTVPSKQPPPKKFSNRTSRSTLVSNRINQLHDKINSNHEESDAFSQDTSTVSHCKDNYINNRKINDESDLSSKEDLSLSIYTEESSTTDIFSTLRKENSNMSSNKSFIPSTSILEGVKANIRKQGKLNLSYPGRQLDNEDTQSEVMKLDDELVSIGGTNSSDDDSFDVFKSNRTSVSTSSNNKDTSSGIQHRKKLVNDTKSRNLASSQHRKCTIKLYGSDTTSKNGNMTNERKAFAERSLNIQ